MLLIFMSQQKKLLKYLITIPEKSPDAFKETSKQGKGLKILTPKQMFQRLPIALAQIKAGNN